MKCPRCDQGHDVKSRREEIKAGVKDYLGTMREISRLCRLMYDDGVSMTMLYLYAERGLMESQGWRMEARQQGQISVCVDLSHRGCRGRDQEVEGDPGRAATRRKEV